MSSPADGARLALVRPAELHDRLAPLGLSVAIDVVGTLAVVRLAPDARAAGSLRDASLRSDVVAAARACGFSHVALEL